MINFGLGVTSGIALGIFLSILVVRHYSKKDANNEPTFTAYPAGFVVDITIRSNHKFSLRSLAEDLAKYLPGGKGKFITKLNISCGVPAEAGTDVVYCISPESFKPTI
jgi:hypothetical protein